MILEEERIAQEKAQLKMESDLCYQKIKVAERYERLLANKDFKDMLKDLEDTLKIHKSQLDILDYELQDCNSPFKMNRLTLVRKIHLARMQQIKEAVHRPEILVRMGQEAKSRLDEIKELEKELPNG